MFYSALFAAVLMIVAIFLMSQQREAWQKAQQEDLDEDRKLYLKQQNKRRLTVSYILMAIAVMIAIASLIQPSIFLLIYWGAVLLLVMWMFVLAGLDILSTSNYLLIVRDRQIVEKRVLEEIHRRKKEESAIDAPEGSDQS